MDPLETSERLCFDGSAPNLQRTLLDFKDERHLWLAASAKGLAASSLAAFGEGQVAQ